MPRFHKYKLLLDEGVPIRTYFPRLNSVHNLKHIVKDLKKSGIKDPEVFSIAKKLKRLVVTYNYRDFQNLLSNTKDTGVVGVSTNLSLEQTDKKISALLSKKLPGELYGKTHYISGETEDDKI